MKYDELNVRWLVWKLLTFNGVVSHDTRKYIAGAQSRHMTENLPRESSLDDFGVGQSWSDGLGRKEMGCGKSSLERNFWSAKHGHVCWMHITEVTVVCFGRILFNMYTWHLFIQKNTSSNLFELRLILLSQMSPKQTHSSTVRMVQPHHSFWPWGLRITQPRVLPHMEAGGVLYWTHLPCFHQIDFRTLHFLVPLKFFSGKLVWWVGKTGHPFDPGHHIPSFFQRADSFDDTI